MGLRPTKRQSLVRDESTVLPFHAGLFNFMRRFFHTLTFSGFLFLGGAALPVLATPHTVTSTKDDGGTYTLHTLIGASLDNDTISFAVTGTSNLTGGELLVGRSGTIIGPGARNLSILRSAGTMHG